MSDSLRFMIILALAVNGAGLPGAETQHSFTNRLAQEKSPYLLQHAHNPVDWFPWGPEAFEKARRENKPIFLSVGYATCHWCHVMERECFENNEIAALMNRHFVNIKVDREERPDIDRIYMAFLIGTTGRGGWPMNVWLTPDRQPIFGGTYFPPEDRNGLPGFPSAIRQLATAWEQQRDKIVASSKELTRQLREQSNLVPGTTNALDRAVLDQTYTELKATFEPRFGGFGRAPKFPRPATLNFMQRYYARTGTRDAREMALFTLRQMAAGGMHDQLGGGFHRYSVDERWHVPHFEKMLYDQAQLACAYLEAHQVTREGFYAAIARDILDYVLRDLTGGEGQFYSAEDADSPLPGAPGTHAEGAFYVWTEPEIRTLLGAPAADIFNYHYGVEPGGNVKSDPHEEFRQKNILFTAQPLEATARRFDKSPAQIETLLRESRQKLLGTRARRPRPLRDDKTLTAWNGLMISAFARAHQVLGDPQYLAAAERAAGFIKTRLYDAKTQTLLRRHRAGESAIDGFVDDYSYLIQGLLDLYEASFRISHLSWALELQTKQDALFWDDKAGGYFSTTDHDPTVLVRMKETYDGAEPSPNSVAALNLLRLAQMLDHAPAHQRAQKIFAAFSQLLARSPDAVPQLGVALDFHLAKPKQIVIAGHPDAPDTRAMVRAVHEQFVPDKIMLLADNAAGQEYLGKRLAFIKAVKMISGQATAYVCRNYVCQLPTTNLTVMTKLLTSAVTR